MLDFLFTNPISNAISVILNAAAMLLELLFSIPLAGRLLKWAWSIVLTLIALAFGVLDGILWLIGIRWEKKLRVGVIILRDENGKALMQPEDVMEGLIHAIQTMYTSANILVLPVWGYLDRTKRGRVPLADELWVKTNPESSRANVLDVHCRAPALKEDLLTAGAEFEFLTTSMNFHGNFRRFVGYGAPVMVFIVRSIDKHWGCSLGPLSDYVTIVKKRDVCISHELGHACNLPHVNDADNMMFRRGCTQDKMSWWQILLLRASRHVSYF